MNSNMENNLKNKHIIRCPISYRSADDTDRQRSMILEYMCPGYQTCNSPKMYCMSTQTLISMADLDNQYFKGTIFKVPTIENIAALEEFSDAIESGDEDFFSVIDEMAEEKTPYAPYSINIELKESPHIIMNDGSLKTKISLTENYIDENGLQLVIEEGTSRNVKLKSGNKDIYPRGSVDSNDVIISVTDISQELNKKCDISLSISKSGNESKSCSYEEEDDLYPCNDITTALRNLASDVDEQKRREASMVEKLELPDAKRSLRSPREHYPPTYKTIKDRLESGVGKSTLFDNDLDILKNLNKPNKSQKGNYKVKQFAWTILEDIPSEQYIPPGKEDPIKSVEVQTDVHIHPNYTSEELTLASEGSDSLLKKSTFLATEPLPFTDNPLKEKATAITQEATMAQRESDLSIITEPTMEGIPELTEKTVSSEEVTNPEMVKQEQRNNIRKQDEMYVTDDEETYMSEDLISNRKLKTTKSASSIGMRSKLTDTGGLDDTSNNDIAIVSNRRASSTSQRKAIQYVEEELSSLTKKFSRLHTEFKSLDIPLELKQETLVGVEGEHFPPLPPASSQVSTSNYRHAYVPMYDFYSHGVFQQQRPSVGNEPCSCPLGTCLGLQRSSGFDCQRIRRLSPRALSSEFQREFIRPYWTGNNAFLPNSIWSEPEDILGGPTERSEPQSTENNDRNNNKSDKLYLFVIVLQYYLIEILYS